MLKFVIAEQILERITRSGQVQYQTREDGSVFGFSETIHGFRNLRKVWREIRDEALAGWPKDLLQQQVWKHEAYHFNALPPGTRTVQIRFESVRTPVPCSDLIQEDLIVHFNPLVPLPRETAVTVALAPPDPSIIDIQSAWSIEPAMTHEILEKKGLLSLLTSRQRRRFSQ